jgi:hypothetical protein
VREVLLKELKIKEKIGDFFGNIFILQKGEKSLNGIDIGSDINRI